MAAKVGDVGSKVVLVDIPYVIILLRVEDIPHVAQFVQCSTLYVFLTWYACHHPLLGLHLPWLLVPRLKNKYF